MKDITNKLEHEFEAPTLILSKITFSSTVECVEHWQKLTSCGLNTKKCKKLALPIFLFFFETDLQYRI